MSHFIGGLSLPLLLVSEVRSTHQRHREALYNILELDKDIEQLINCHFGPDPQPQLVSRIRSSLRKAASPPLGSGLRRNDGLAGFRGLRRNDGLDNLSNESLKRDTSVLSLKFAEQVRYALSPSYRCRFQNP